MASQQLRLADLLAALSVTTDLGMGQRPEKAIRSCLLATGLARAMDLPDRQVRDVYHAPMLRHLGCTASASLEARLYGVTSWRRGHHGVSAGAIPIAARILAAADTLQTTMQDRPHRPARSPDEAADRLTA